MLGTHITYTALKRGLAKTSDCALTYLKIIIFRYLSMKIFKYAILSDQNLVNTQTHVGNHFLCKN
ncbi:MAG: hypothetical protein ACI9J3_002189 [Parvicellaceae bacterium]|jgi:hypothetical protein